jgi:hypothetical protein
VIDDVPLVKPFCRALCHREKLWSLIPVIRREKLPGRDQIDRLRQLEVTIWHAVMPMKRACQLVELSQQPLVGCRPRALRDR